MKINDSSEEKLLFDFTDRSAVKNWFSINDQIMGGASQSQLVSTEQKSAVFKGEISLKNNGGFASVRSQPLDFELKDYQGILIKMRGDGKTYKLNIKTDLDFDGVNFQIKIPTQNNSWEIHRFPFSKFIPTRRGKQLYDGEPLKPEKIKTLGLMVSDKQEGSFRLEIKWIKAFEE